MRNWIDLVSKDGVSFDGIVYHCSNEHFDKFRISPNRGIYFANEPDSEYGKYVYKCRVILKNAMYASSVDTFEHDRNVLISQGFDGRIVDYKEESDYEMYDVIAFYPDQVEILEITKK